MIYESKHTGTCYQATSRGVSDIRIFPDMNLYVKVGEDPIYNHYELRPELRTANVNVKKQEVLHR